jgi:hypothetical protein
VQTGFVCVAAVGFVALGACISFLCSSFWSLAKDDEWECYGEVLDKELVLGEEFFINGNKQLVNNGIGSWKKCNIELLRSGVKCNFSCEFSIIA